MSSPSLFCFLLTIYPVEQSTLHYHRSTRLPSNTHKFPFNKCLVPHPHRFDMGIGRNHFTFVLGSPFRALWSTLGSQYRQPPLRGFPCRDGIEYQHPDAHRVSVSQWSCDSMFTDRSRHSERFIRRGVARSRYVRHVTGRCSRPGHRTHHRLISR